MPEQSLGMVVTVAVAKAQCWLALTIGTEIKGLLPETPPLLLLAASCCAPVQRENSKDSQNEIYSLNQGRILKGIEKRYINFLMNRAVKELKFVYEINIYIL